MGVLGFEIALERLATPSIAAPSLGSRVGKPTVLLGKPLAGTADYILSLLAGDPLTFSL
jgi:hypothetical protein